VALLALGKYDPRINLSALTRDGDFFQSMKEVLCIAGDQELGQVAADQVLV
jgi:hypothetical protein